MARTARFKIEDQETFYHLYARTSGPLDQYPLQEQAAKRELIRILHKYAEVYYCELATYCVLGNHYHVVIKFEQRRPVEEGELRDRARKLYPGKAGAEMVARWTEVEWKRLERRLFDVSEYMRNVQSRFAVWYNRTYGRRGRFWAGRFKSTVLSDMESVLECMVYVDLNAVRAGLVERPEDWEAGALYQREIGRDKGLMRLEAVTGSEGKEALREYKGYVYHRGGVATRVGQKAISEEVIRKEEARGFRGRGIYMKRLRYFTDGVAIGTEVFIRQQIVKLREKGQYMRRVNPIPQLEGFIFSLREQRGQA